MKLNTKVRYGLRAMLEIAMNPEGILQKNISINQSISLKYLDQIIYSLKTAGLIARSSGKNKGYKLIKPADKISIYDIYKAFEHKLNINNCETNLVGCLMAADCNSKNYWCSLNDFITMHMESKTLADILERA